MKNLIAAIIKFQQEVPTIPKNKVNPHYKSKYSDLAIVIEKCSPVLNKHGLTVIQTFKTEQGKNELETILCHESGETITSHIFLPELQDPQKLTSAITYLRRSAYLSICGLVGDEEDDGNYASGVTQAPQSKPPLQQSFTPPASKGAQYPASEAQKNALTKMGIYFSNDISKSEASALIEKANKDRNSK